MKERGMIFNTEMVKAILEGRKTQTRRPVKPQPSGEFCRYDLYIKGQALWSSGDVRHSPFGIPGDRIYVRETWCKMKTASRPEDNRIHYLASAGKNNFLWRPSIHMPREAARLFLEITDVRVERVRDISEEDAIAEGMKSLGFTEGNPHKALYAQLYESIYGPDSWEKDWVWVYKFKVL